MDLVRAASGGMERTELAWAAGFWDGEGWANLVRYGRGDALRPMARVNQADAASIPQVLVRFHRVIGFGRISGPHIEEGREPIYRWVASSADNVRRLFELIGPWLGVVKRRQFETACSGSVARIPWASLAPAERTAWAAGLFDGEGSVYLAKHQSHAGYVVLEAAISQSGWEGAPEVLERFLDFCGSGKIYGPYPNGDGYPPVYRWKAHRRAQVEALIHALGQQLGDVKQEQAKNAIAAVSAQLPLKRGNPAWGSHKTHCVNGHDYSAVRLRPFRGRGKNAEPRRASKQCLACVRDSARRTRERRQQRAAE